jgi:D-alanine-D-alanine ligase
MKKNIIILCGGGGTEHDVSLVSSKFIYKNLIDLKIYNVFLIEIGKDKKFRDQAGNICELNLNKELLIQDKKVLLHFAIPCIHGPPGETGEIQNFFEMIDLPYMGCGPEASIICFNKITSKLWFNALDIPNTPFAFLTSINDLDKAYQLFDRYGKIFVKAASQGSSVGCFQVFNRSELEKIISEAFKYSEYVLVEQMLNARELEISTYEFNNEIITTIPGEIVCPGKFYSFEEKYNPESKTTTEIIAPNLSAEIVNKMREYAKKAFLQLKLRHLSRIDFFYTDKGEIYLNEINTFPGMTPISMFPKMMENHGHNYNQFLKQIIEKNINK